MSSIKSALSTHITEVVEDMNKELLNDRIVSFWGKVAPELTLRQLVDTYWKDTKSEFAVDLGVTFGKIFELYLPFKLKSLGYDVEPQFSSSGDMIENTPNGKIYWELKTGRGKFIPRPGFPPVHEALKKWKELNSPRKVERDPMNIPAGI